MKIRVRYAPSPTGRQHIGTVRTALYDYLAARATGGTFILRIEDTDQERSTPESLDNLYRTFEWLGVHWDEGPDVGGPHAPYIQSQRLGIYQEHARRLVAEGKAYYCFCSTDRLERLRKGQVAKKDSVGYDRHCRDLSDTDVKKLLAANPAPVIRFKIPLEGETVVRDELLGEVRHGNRDIPADPVILKSDGFPTYHLAHPIDDELMGITHVLRGQEWLPSAPLHVLLFQALGYAMPRYYHLPVVLGTDGQKLSKRHGDTSIEEFRERGYLPEAIINYVARLGWSYDDKTEFLSREDLEKLFSLERLNKSPAVFDYKKLNWLNGQHMRKRSPDEIRDLVRPYLVRDSVLSNPPTPGEEAVLEQSIPLIHERLGVLEDASALLRFAFRRVEPPNADALLPKGLDRARTREVLRAVYADLEGFESRSDEENEVRARALADRLGLKLGVVLAPMRVALTGSPVSPPLFGCMRLLGPDEVKERVARALQLLAG